MNQNTTGGKWKTYKYVFPNICFHWNCKCIWRQVWEAASHSTCRTSSSYNGFNAV